MTSLKHVWNLWAHLPQDPNWSEDSYKLIHRFGTLEEVIGVTEMLQPELLCNCMLFIMKDGIAPMWEDPMNVDGGCFSYRITNKLVPEVWKELTYVLVGNTISTNDHFAKCVNGITISPKKNFCIIKIWTSTCEHQNPTIVTTDIKNLPPRGCLFKKHGT